MTAWTPSAEADLLLRFLQYMATPAPRETVAGFCCQLLVQSGMATSAAIMYPTGPDVIHCVCWFRDQAGTLHHDQFDSATPLTLLLCTEAVSQLVPESQPSAHRLVQLLTDCPAAFVADATVPWHQLEHEVSHSAELIRTVIRCIPRLLRNATDVPASFPQAERLASLAEFAAGAGHEINNPLGSILGQTQLLLKTTTEIGSRQSLETIGAQAWRIRDMIGQTMLFARPPVPATTEFDLAAVADIVCAAARETLQSDEIQVTNESSVTHVSIRGDQPQLTTLMDELIRNAAEAIRGTNHPGTIRLRVTPYPDHHAVGIRIRDNGLGLTDSLIQRHLFDPFFSGRQAGRGLGFGLSLCYQIVRSHHGILLPWSNTDETCFEIALPHNTQQLAT
ncbi:MAG: HAMP domain-containing histidine kinase [Planctomycetaceae bacterium]|nr:HAMP domain-containing histidine kinase [Planctomycetaceae bacterium]